MISKVNVQTYEVLDRHFNFKIHSKSRKNHKELFNIVNKFDFTKCNEQYVKNALEVIEMLFRKGEYLRVSNIFENYDNSINIEFKDIAKTTDLYSVLNITNLNIEITDRVKVEYWAIYKDIFEKYKSYDITLDELTKYFTVTTSIYGHFRKEI